MQYLILGVILLAFFFLTFLVAQRIKNNGLIDVIWGIGFIVTAITSYILGQPSGIAPIIMVVCVLIWGSRLSYYLIRRNVGKPEDLESPNILCADVYPDLSAPVCFKLHHQPAGYCDQSGRFCSLRVGVRSWSCALDHRLYF